MIGKRGKSALLAATLILSMIAVFGASPSVSADPALPHVYVLPQNTTMESDVPCFCTDKEFTVEVKITGVTDCYGVDFWLNYDGEVLQQVGKVDIHGPFASGNPPIRPDPIVYPGGYVLTELSVNGTVRVSLTFVFAVGAPSFNGTGTVCSITFKVVKCPDQLTCPPGPLKNCVNSTLAFDETKVKIWDPTGAAQPRNPSVNGWFECCILSLRPGAPTAEIKVNGMHAPSHSVYVCDPVVLDGTQSDPGPPPAVIHVYIWNITYTNCTGDVVNVDIIHIEPPDLPIIEFHCNMCGIVYVSLTVWNCFNMSDTDKTMIYQEEKIGCITDVFTWRQRFCGQITDSDKVGKGINKNADAFAPGDKVHLYAEVTYNGAPVNHILVAFEVLWEYEELPDQTLIFHNSCVLYRVAETNKSGIAEIGFRIPLLTCQVPDSYYPLGKWVVVATAKVQSVKQEDQLRFDVNYILRIAEAWTTYGGVPATKFYTDCDWMDVEIVIKNIAWIWKHVWITVVAYDECQVPLDQCVIPWEVPPGAYCHPSHTLIPIFDCIHIPQWAFVGAGWVYINLFTRLPRDCGVPYCPETALPIMINFGPRP